MKIEPIDIEAILGRYSYHQTDYGLRIVRARIDDLTRNLEAYFRARITGEKNASPAQLAVLDFPDLHSEGRMEGDTITSSKFRLRNRKYNSWRVRRNRAKANRLYDE